jgi:two-component system NarL family sensor kinase
MAWIRQVGFALWFVGFVGLPVAIGIAILRNRLYEIDLIINRTLVYGALAVAMASVFEAIDATLHYFLVTIAHVHTLPGSIIAALVVGALFDPVRNRIQRFVNRYLYPGEAGAPGRPEGAGPP